MNQGSQQSFFLNPDPSRVALHQLFQKIHSMCSRILPSVYIHHHQKHEIETAVRWSQTYVAGSDATHLGEVSLHCRHAHTL